MTPEDDALAAEYVLGTDPDRDATARRIAADSGFAALVDDWQTRLCAMDEGFAETPAPPLLPAIEARLFGRAPRRWRWPALGGLLAASVAGFLLIAPLGDDRVMTRLASADQALIVDASYSRAEGMVRMERMAGPAAPDGSAYEGWIILPGQTPVSLGMLGDGMMEMPAGDLPQGTVIAVSMEPAGGSTTGQPTGPVILSAVMDI